MAFVTSFSNENLSVSSFNLSRRAPPQAKILSEPVKITIGFAYFLIGIITVFGNSLTIAVFLRGNFRRKRVHYLLINLAITDLTLAIIPVPLQIVKHLTQTPSRNLYTIQYFFDALTGLTSMYSLAFISVERLCAVCLPIRHRLLTFIHYVVIISIGWFIAGAVAIISSDIFTTRLNLISISIVLHIRTLFVAVPLVVVIIAYCSLLVIRCSQKTTIRAQQQNRRTACTLLIVTAVFMVTWCPFLIHSTVVSYLRFYGICCSRPPTATTLILIINLEKLLQYGNSCINPFIYNLRISSFRMAFWEILRCRRRSNNSVAGLRQNIITTSNIGGRDINVWSLVKVAGENSGVKNCPTSREMNHQAFSCLSYKESEVQVGQHLDLCNIQLTSFKTLDS